MSKQKGRGIMDRAKDALGIQHQDPAIAVEEDNLPLEGGEPAIETQPPPIGETAVSIRERLRKLLEKQSDNQQEIAALRARLCQIEAREAPAQREAELKEQQFWPDGQAFPQHYIKRRPQPCRKCRRMLLRSGSQAVVVTSAGKDIAFFRCKGCGHTFQMPVQEA